MTSTSTPGVPAAAWIARYRALEATWRRAWPGRLFGVEHVPSHGRFLLVANHSGLGVAECATFPGLWLDAFVASARFAHLARTSCHPAPLRGFRLA